MDDLLCEPSVSELAEALHGSVSINEDIRICRPVHKFKDLSDAFVIKPRVYAQQYSAVYFCRLNKLRKAIYAAAKARWGDSVFVCSGISDVKLMESCVIIGTLYKDMKLRPSVLDEYLDGLSIKCTASSFVSPSDYLIMEDETSRIRLCTAIKTGDAVTGGGVTGDDVIMSSRMDPNNFVTGLIVGVLGIKMENGEFEVNDWTFAGIPYIPLPMSTQHHKTMYVGFVSGLYIGSPNNKNLKSLILLREYLMGTTGCSTSSICRENIVRLIVCGNSIDSTSSTSDNLSVMALLDEVDSFFSDVARTIHIDVMPGSKDPTTYCLPQQPLHPTFFPLATKYSTFRPRTNAYMFSVEGIRFLGTSGQPIEDVCAFSKIHSHIDALEMTAKSRCIAPTSPDTLPCYPFTKDDPFALTNDTYPHVLFTGNSPTAAWRHLPSDVSYDNEGKNPSLLCLCVPTFSSTPSLVLVNLVDLNVSIINFG